MIREFPGFISFADHLDSSHYNDNQWQELLTKYQLFQESDAKYQTQGPQEGLDSLRLLHEIPWIQSHLGRVTTAMEKHRYKLWMYIEWYGTKHLA